jgi:hypothetical protein
MGFICTRNNYTASDGEFFSIPIDKPIAARVWLDRFILRIAVGSHFVAFGIRASFVRAHHIEPIAAVASMVCGDFGQYLGGCRGLVDGFGC